MAVPSPRKKYALDTNVLIDMAEGKSFALQFLHAYKPHVLKVPPTVVQELSALAEKGDSVSKYAFSALSSMRSWGITPFDLIPCGHGITESQTRELIRRKLLPEEEFNDGYLLIETALALIPNLVTSDLHLLKINPQALNYALGDMDLPPVTIFHPKALLSLTGH
jgi:hypothetical protein